MGQEGNPYQAPLEENRRGRLAWDRIAVRIIFGIFAVLFLVLIVFLLCAGFFVFGHLGDP
jgi:hypothetical protein